jgi:hypothetical protein
MILSRPLGPARRGDEVGIEQVHVGPGLQPQAFDDAQQGRLAGDRIEEKWNSRILARSAAVSPRLRAASSSFAMRRIWRPVRVSRPGRLFRGQPLDSDADVAQSMILSRVISGTRTERLGRISNAPSATSRRIASRTGVRLTPSVPAMKRNDSFCPAVNRPAVSASRRES